MEENFLTQLVREPTREDTLVVCEQKRTVGNHLGHAIMKSVFDSQRREQVEGRKVCQQNCHTGHPVGRLWPV